MTIFIFCIRGGRGGRGSRTSDAAGMVCRCAIDQPGLHQPPTRYWTPPPPCFLKTSSHAKPHKLSLLTPDYLNFFGFYHKIIFIITRYYLKQIWPTCNAICICKLHYKFGHQMAPLPLVTNLATRWCHRHLLQHCKFYHQMH